MTWTDMSTERFPGCRRRHPGGGVGDGCCRSGSVRSGAAETSRGRHRARARCAWTYATKSLRLRAGGACAAARAAAGYIGEATCLGCHDEQKKGYADTMHGRSDHPRAPAAKFGCETCHGPGAKHVEEPDNPLLIRRFLKIPPREVSETCLTCHSRGEHALWEGSQHDARNLSCVTCHSVHAFKSEHAQLKTTTELRTVRHVPSRQGRQARSLRPHAGARRQDAVLDVPQPARLDQREAAAQGRFDRRDLHVVPRRQARPVPLGARARAATAA